VQSFSLKWSNYSFAECDGYKYVRIRRDFILSDDEDYTTALIKSNDIDIGIFIAIPSNELS